jgi:hypothetical protein
VALTTFSTITDAGWTSVASGAAETLLTSDGDGFFWLVSNTLPSATTVLFGHAVDGYENEPVVTITGETLYVRSRDSVITLAITQDV